MIGCQCIDELVNFLQDQSVNLYYILQRQMEDAVPAQPNWCLFQAVNPQLTYVQIFCLSYAVGVWVVLAFSFKYHNKYQTFSSKSSQSIKTIYKLIIGWSAIFAFKLFFNLIVYWAMMHQNTDLHPPLKYLNFLFNVFDVGATSIVNTILIYVPLNWIKNVIQNLQIQQISPQLQSKRQKYKAFLLYYRVYNQYRWIIMAVSPVLMFQAMLGVYSPLFMKCIVFSIMLEVFIIFTLYLFGIIVFNTFQEVIAQNIPNKCWFYFQYIILGWICLFRLVRSSTLWIFDLYPMERNYNCQAQNQSQSDQHTNIINAILLLMGLTIMHLLPISIMLFQCRPIKPYNSLLQSTNQQQKAIS